MDTYQYAIDVHIAMNHHLSRLVHARSKTAAEEEDVQSPFELHEHQAAQRSLRSLRTRILAFLQERFRKVDTTTVLVCKVLLLGLLSSIRLVWPNIWQSTREEPALEDFLGDVVAVVASHEPLAAPPLLEESHVGTRECHFMRDWSERTTPEDV